jgi:hypothetical protein
MIEATTESRMMITAKQTAVRRDVICLAHRRGRGMT